MKIAEWLEAENLTNIAFAERVGVSESAVSKWRRGKRLPRDPRVIGRIADVTGGAVTANDIFASQDVPA